MLNREMFMSNGLMMNISLEKMKHPEWKVDNKYCFVANKEWGNYTETPESIIHKFLGKNCKVSLIKAFTEPEIHKIPITRRLCSNDCKRALKSAYNVCIDGIGKDDYIDFLAVGPYECLVFWHLTEDGRPRWKLEAVRDTRSGNVKVCICGVFKGAK